jgi:hypothetical protein
MCETGEQSPVRAVVGRMHFARHLPLWLLRRRRLLGRFGGGAARWRRAFEFEVLALCRAGRRCVIWRWSRRRGGHLCWRAIESRDEYVNRSWEGSLGGLVDGRRWDERSNEWVGKGWIWE